MDNLANYPQTGCAYKATVVAGTTTTITNTGTIYFHIKSKAYSKGAMTNAATPTTDAVTGAAFVPVVTNKGSVFVIGLNKDGTVLCAQGSIEGLDAAGAFINAPQFPVVPDTMAPIAYLVIKAGSTASSAGWIFGTSNNSSVTGITYTFVDVAAGLPDRPQIA